MNSVQENKNELEAAVRYCESAISRANATIESMEFRQQAATKAWHEQTGREAALEREVARLRAINAERETMVQEGKEDRATLVKKVAELKTQLVEWRDRSSKYTNEIGELKEKYEEAKTNMALMTDELEEMSKTYNDECHETNVWKKENAKLAASNARLLNKQQEMEQTMQLQKDQIAMFQRKMSRMNEMER